MIYDAVIAGAGIGGLTLGYYLQQAGKQVLILETLPSGGGLIKSDRVDGFLLERGPNSTALKDAFSKLVDDVGLSSELLHPAPASKKKYLGTYRTKDGLVRILPLPAGPVQALTHPVLSFPAKLRIFAEPFIAKTTLQDESVASFISRRFGHQLAENIVSAVLSGIWACDINQLSTRSTMPLQKLWELEQAHGSVIRGMIKNRGNKRPGPLIMVSFKRGMQSLAEALENALRPGTLQSNTELFGFSKEKDLVVVEARNRQTNEPPRTYRARHLVLTTSASLTAALIRPHDTALAAQIAAVPSAPLGVLHVAYKASDITHPLDAFGFLLPPRKGKALLGALFSSSVFENRAPAGYHLLTCFVGGAANPALSDVTNDAIRSQAIGELTPLIGAKTAPRILSQIYYSAAIPNYPVGHFKLQTGIVNFHQRNPNIHFLSNWYDGLGVSDRIEKATILAEQMILMLSYKDEIIPTFANSRP